TAAVPSKHPRARTLQPLLRHNRIVDAAAEFGLCDAIRAEYARGRKRRARAETEMQRLTGEHLCLLQQSRSDLDVAADAKRVDALIARILLRTWTNDFPVITRRT